MMCDKHVVKMILESCQILWAVYHCTCDADWEIFVPENLVIYKQTHTNHPCTIWARKTYANFMWLARHARALCSEYTHRYNKRHTCQSAIEWFLEYPAPCDASDAYKPTTVLAGIDYPEECTPPPIAITNAGIHVVNQGRVSLVSSYRNYYLKEKRFAKWKLANEPNWWRFQSSEYPLSS